MSISKIMGCMALLTALVMAPFNPASAADRKTTNTILGAGVGAAAGAVLSQGDTLATLGGAAAGGLLGNILTEEPRKRHHHAGPPHRHHHHVKHSKPGKKHWKHHSKHRSHGKHHHRR